MHGAVVYNDNVFFHAHISSHLYAEGLPRVPKYRTPINMAHQVLYNQEVQEVLKSEQKEHIVDIGGVFG